MPVFTLLCPGCGNEQRSLLKNVDIYVYCGCGYDEPMEIQLPKNISTESFEMKDKLRGVQVSKNMDKKLKKRMTDHHDKHLVAEKIDKWGMDDALKFGWDKKAIGKK